ncbi:NTP transferase domain-containing protein, partial [Calditrichota bacterium]
MKMKDNTTYSVLITAHGRSQRVGCSKLRLGLSGDPLLLMMVERLQFSGWEHIAVTVDDENDVDFIKTIDPSLTAIPVKAPANGDQGWIETALKWAGAASSGLLIWSIDYPMVGVTALKKIHEFATADMLVVP